jgi:hypothetical protein
MLERMKLVLANAIALATLLAACAPAPPRSAQESPLVGAPIGKGASASTQADGVLVTLALSADTVVGGERISIRISALNVGLGPVAYSAGGCGPIMNVAVEGPPIAARPVLDPPQAGGGEGALALAKWSALSQGDAQLDTVRTSGIPDDAFVACTADLRFEDLDPGETFADDGTWIARIGDGAPAPAGPYSVEFDFPFAGRVAKDQVDMDVAVRPIHVSVPLMVEPGPRVVLDAIAAIDAAIADPRVIVWANRGLTRQNLTGATITMIDGRWRWRIMQAGGQADVFIDPVSGRVVETDL